MRIEKNIKSRMAICGLKIWGQPVIDSTMDPIKNEKKVFLNSIDKIKIGKDMLVDGSKGEPF